MVRGRWYPGIPQEDAKEPTCGIIVVVLVSNFAMNHDAVGLTGVEACIQHVLDSLDQSEGFFNLLGDTGASGTIDWEQRVIVPLLPEDLRDVILGQSKYQNATDEQLWHATAALHAAAYRARGQHDLIRAAEAGKQSAATPKPKLQKSITLKLDAFTYQARPAMPGMLAVHGQLEDRVLPKRIPILISHISSQQPVPHPPPEPVATAVVPMQVGSLEISSCSVLEQQRDPDSTESGDNDVAATTEASRNAVAVAVVSFARDSHTVAMSAIAEAPEPMAVVVERPPAPGEQRQQQQEEQPPSPVLGQVQPQNQPEPEEEEHEQDEEVDVDPEAEEQDHSEDLNANNDEEEEESDDPEQEAELERYLKEADELAAAEAVEAKLKKPTLKQDDLELPVEQIIDSRIRKRKQEKIEEMRLFEQQVAEEKAARRRAYEEAQRAYEQSLEQGDAESASSKQKKPRRKRKPIKPTDSDEEDGDYAQEGQDESSSSSISEEKDAYKEDDEEEEEGEEAVESGSEEEEAAEESSAASPPKKAKKTATPAPPPPPPVIVANGKSKAIGSVEKQKLAQAVREVMGPRIAGAQAEARAVATSTPKQSKKAATARAAPPPPAEEEDEDDQGKRNAVAERQRTLQRAIELLAAHELRILTEESTLGRLCKPGVTLSDQDAMDKAAFWSCFYRAKAESLRITDSNDLDKMAHRYLQRVREKGKNVPLRELLEMLLQPDAKLVRRPLDLEGDELPPKCEVLSHLTAESRLLVEARLPQSDSHVALEPYVSDQAYKVARASYFAAHIIELFKKAILEYLEKELELPEYTRGTQYVAGLLKSSQIQHFQKQWLAAYDTLSAL